MRRRAGEVASPPSILRDLHSLTMTLPDDLAEVASFDAGKSYVANNLADILVSKGFDVWTVENEGTTIAVVAEESVATLARQLLPSLRRRHGNQFSRKVPLNPREGRLRSVILLLAALHGCLIAYLVQEPLEDPRFALFMVGLGAFSVYVMYRRPR